jgi:two-component system, OmpR family, alkaline phosphatase synthesis response regulator PhoP
MNDAKKILLVEDEEGLVLTVVDRLNAEGYEVVSETDGNSAFSTAKNGRFDAIILDIMLPGKSGFDVCRDLRAAGINTPIMMTTAKTQVSDRVVGLKLGADDYVCKPFDMNELVARLEALIRRATKEGRLARNVPDWRVIHEWGKRDYTCFSIDFASAIVERNGEQFQLTGQEFKLLAYLISHSGKIVSRQELLDTVWDYDNKVTTRTVDVHIAWLRKKIGDSDPIPSHIQTVRRMGYRFQP